MKKTIDEFYQILKDLQYSAVLNNAGDKITVATPNIEMEDKVAELAKTNGFLSSVLMMNGGDYVVIFN